MNNKNVFKVWALYQSLGFVLGWLFHSVVSHLFTGEHDFQLSIPQLIMHNVSMIGMTVILLVCQNRANSILFGISIMKHWIAYIIIPVALFWAGYYGVGAPVDIVFLFITISVVNGILLTRYLQLKRWTLYSILSSIIGIVIGTCIATPLEPVLLAGLTGLQKHIVVFTIEGSAVGIPMAIAGGLFLQKVTKRATTANA